MAENAECLQPKLVGSIDEAAPDLAEFSNVRLLCVVHARGKKIQLVKCEIYCKEQYLFFLTVLGVFE